MTQTQQYNVTLIGTEGTGKTCFLAGLAILGFDPIRGAPFQIFPPDEETKRYLNNLRDTLQNGSWMPPTNISTFISFDLVFSQIKTELRLQILDYSGENFRKAFTELTPDEAAQSFSEHLTASKVVLLLLDANELASISSEEQRRTVSQKIRAQFAAVNGKVVAGADIGVLITKSDTIPALKGAAGKSDHGSNDAEQFVKEHLGDDFKKMLRRVAKIGGFQDIRNIDIRQVVFFPVSAVGTTENGKPVKDGLKPYGYDVVFQWVAERPERLWNTRVLSATMFALLCIAVIVGVCLTIWRGHVVVQGNREAIFQSIMEDLNLSVIEKLEKANEFMPLTAPMRERRRNVVDEELVNMKERIESAKDSREWTTIRDELVRLRELGVSGAENELQIQIDDVDKKIVEFFYKRIENAFNDKSPTFLSDADAFLRNYPNVPEAANVRDMRNQWGQDRIREERSRIYEITVRDPSQLRNKMERVGEYLRNYKESLRPGEQEEIGNAVELARKFLESTNYVVTVRQYGGFAYKEDIKLNVMDVNGKRNVHTSNGKAQVVNPSATFNVQWKSGELIELEIEAYGGFAWGGIERAASVKSSDADAISLLRGRQSLTAAKGGRHDNSYWDWGTPSRMADGGYFIHSEIQGISPEQWRAFEKWIKPGDGWREAL